jgi:hypothetical protein
VVLLAAILLERGRAAMSVRKGART